MSAFEQDQGGEEIDSFLHFVCSAWGEMSHGDHILHVIYVGLLGVVDRVAVAQRRSEDRVMMDFKFPRAEPLGGGLC
jgi:hypothetical protein